MIVQLTSTSLSLTRKARMSVSALHVPAPRHCAWRMSSWAPHWAASSQSWRCPPQARPRRQHQLGPPPLALTPPVLTSPVSQRTHPPLTGSRCPSPPRARMPVPVPPVAALGLPLWRRWRSSASSATPPAPTATRCGASLSLRQGMTAGDTGPAWNSHSHCPLALFPRPAPTPQGLDSELGLQLAGLTLMCHRPTIAALMGLGSDMGYATALLSAESGTQQQAGAAQLATSPAPPATAAGAAAGITAPAQGAGAGAGAGNDGPVRAGGDGRTLLRLHISMSRLQLVMPYEVLSAHQRVEPGLTHQQVVLTPRQFAQAAMDNFRWARNELLQKHLQA